VTSDIVNVGTVGHIDWSQKHLALDLDLIMRTQGSCTCLTKTPNVEYHNVSCRYRLIMEEADEAYRKARTDSSGSVPSMHELTAAGPINKVGE